MRVLVVEDEPEMLGLLRDGLREHGHTVMVAADGEDGLALARAHEFDVVVLDVLLPKMNGRAVAQALRASANRDAPGGRQAGILMLTACDREDEIISGLDMGADDYMTKPFSFVELLARLRSVVRSVESAPDNCLRVEDMVFDLSHRQVMRNGQLIELTRTEMALLECLMRAAGEPVLRHSLIEAVWGGEGRIGGSTLDAFVNLLRNKVDAPFGTRLIQTIRGVGYRIGSASKKTSVGVTEERGFKAARR